MRQDTAWLKQGIQGRQTRNKTQVAASLNRQDELKSLKDRNTATGRSAAVAFQASERKTHKLLVAQGVTKSLGGKPLFADLDFTLSPGTRLGLLGPNGSGKTTLMRLITGQRAPDAGTLTPADKLRIVNFSQHREGLDLKANLRDALCPVGDTVHFQGKSIHVSAWAKKFLFDPAKFRMALGDLSGGEQARVLIAGLMLQPADLLILDEPTNDLDIPTLEILEESLRSFPGAIVLVTHDRFMLSRLATDLIALDGKGGAKNHASYAQWEQAFAQSSQATASPNAAKNPPKSKPTRPADPPQQPKKLSYKLQRELDQMEEKILEAESQVQTLTQEACDPKVMADHQRHAKRCEALSQAEANVQSLYARWEELEAM